MTEPEARQHPPPDVATAAAADLDALGARFADGVLAAEASGGEPTALVAREALVEIVTFLREERGYQLLRSVTAVDYLPSQPRFHVVYHLTAIPASVVAGDPSPAAGDPARLLRLKVPVPADDPVVPTVTGVYPTANYHERETFDMFGVEFAGHPDLRRILMPDAYDGHPLRKDHPLQYEEVAFTFNQDEVMSRKPRAEA